MAVLRIDVIFVLEITNLHNHSYHMNANKRFSLSRYAIPFHRDGQYLIFSSKTCNFYKLEKDVYDYVCDFKDIAKEPEDSDEEAMLEDMRSKGLMIYPGEDEDYVERLRFLNNITSFSKSSVTLTVTPTLCCNLRYDWSSKV